MSGARATPRPPPLVEGDAPTSEREDLELIVSCQNGAWTLQLPRETTIVLGRDATCDVVIQDESISRRHAIIHRGVPPMIEDLGSTNGTVVLGKPVSTERVPSPVPICPTRGARGRLVTGVASLGPAPTRSAS